MPRVRGGGGARVIHRAVVCVNCRRPTPEHEETHPYPCLFSPGTCWTSPPLCPECDGTGSVYGSYSEVCDHCLGLGYESP